ncbi:hypothetical protein J4453_02690 [Candidatus Woesearchaeota archaeon]|nr:hypothetical protein [Candidatus Woesearchaeota archaeon]
MVQRLKPVLPSLREKKRFMAFEVISDSKIESPRVVSESIKSASLRFLGELGTSRMGIRVLEDQYNPQTQRGIVRINHKHADHMRAVLALIQQISSTKVLVRSIGVSGILKKAKHRYMAG